MKSSLLFSTFCILVALKSFSQTIYTLDSINTVGFNRNEFYYDQLDRHILTLNHQFLGTQGSYVLSDGISYVFNSNDYLIEQEFSSVQNNLFSPVVKTLLNYDAQGLVSSITNLWFDLPTSTYWNSNKTDYIRNASGDVVTELFFNYQNNSWSLSGQNSYSYTANNPVELVFQTTMDNGMTFNNAARQTYIYNANNFPTEQAFYSWSNGAWEASSKSTYAYDAANNITQILGYNMNNSNWDEYFKEDFNYNAANDFDLYESFMKLGNNWAPQYKAVYTYSAPLLQDLVVPAEFFTSNSKLDVEQIYEPVGPSWSLIRTSNYNYSEEITNSIASLNDNKISVYPVPSNDILNVLVENESKQVKIFNSLGKLLFEVNLIKGLNQLSMEGLSNGTYFINDETNNLNVRFTVIN